MTDKKAFENLTFYLSTKDVPEKVWEYARQIEKDLEVLEILKKNVDIDLLKANEKAPIVITILRCKPLTNTIDKEYQKDKGVVRE